MRIIGLDLSLTSTGVAGYQAPEPWIDSVKSKSEPEDRGQFRRLRHIIGRVMDHARGADLVVVEGLSQHSVTGQHLTRAGLWHVLMMAVDGLGIPWCEVAPAAIKRYATGKGNASKDEVLAAVVRRYPDVPVMGNDEADALVLVAMAAHHYQVSTLPSVPQSHATALAKVDWPEVDHG